MSLTDGSGTALSWRPASDKFRLLAGILLTASAAYGIAFLCVATSRGWPAGFGDSFALWSWGRFVGTHAAAAIYDQASLRPAQLAMGMDPGASWPFGYPPSFLLILWPLGKLPGWAAYVTLTGVGVPLYLWATLGRDWRPSRLFAALAAPTTAIALVSGQSGFLAAGLLAGGLRLVADCPIAAGVLFGLLTFKPQLGLLVPVALVAARLWRVLGVAAATAALLVAVTSLLFGGAIWPAWAAAVPAFSRQFAAESGEILHLMPTVLAALLQHGVSPPIAQLAQWATTAAAATIVWALFRSGASLEAAAGLLIAAPLATPYAFVYDMPILASAIIWLVAERNRTDAAFGTGEVLVLILALLAPVVLAAGHSSFPLAPLALILLLGVVVRAVRRRVPARAAPPPGRLSAAGSP